MATSNLPPTQSADPWSAMAGEQSPDALPNTPSSGGESAFPTLDSAPPALIRAIISAESSGDPNAHSDKGAVGLMQLEPSTARSLGVTDLTDPQQNVTAGTKYINQLLARYHGNLPLALAAYNMGPTALDALMQRSGAGSWGQVSPHLPSGVVQYVNKVAGHLPGTSPAAPPQGPTPAQAGTAPAFDWGSMAGEGGPSTAPAPGTQLPHSQWADQPRSSGTGGTALGLGALQGGADFGQSLLGYGEDLGHLLEKLPGIPGTGFAALRAGARAVAPYAADAEHALGVDPQQRQQERALYNEFHEGHPFLQGMGRVGTNLLLTAPFSEELPDLLGKVPGLGPAGKKVANLLVKEGKGGNLVSRFPLGRTLYRAGEGALQGAGLGLALGGDTPPAKQLPRDIARDALMAGTGNVLTGWMIPRVAGAIERGVKGVGGLFQDAADSATRGVKGPAAVATGVPAEGGPAALDAALRKEGVDPATLNKQYVAKMRAIASRYLRVTGSPAPPEELARAASLMHHGFNPTSAMVTRDPEMWADEDMIRRTPYGEALQKRYLENNFNAVQWLRNQVGVHGGGGPLLYPEEAGQRVIDAVQNHWDAAQKEVGKLYDNVADNFARQGMGVPYNLANKLDEYKGVNEWDQLSTAVRNKLDKWGLLNKGEVGPNGEVGEPTIKPLNIKEAVNLRKFISGLPNANPTLKWGVNQLVQELDKDLAEGAAPEANSAVREAIDAAHARFARFREGHILQRIVDGRADPTSLITREALGVGSGNASPEALKALKIELQKSPQGMEAWNAVKQQAAQQIASRAGVRPPETAGETPSDVRPVLPDSLEKELTRLRPKLGTLFDDGGAGYQSFSRALNHATVPPAGTAINYSGTAAGHERLNALSAAAGFARHPLHMLYTAAKEGVPAVKGALLENDLLRGTRPAELSQKAAKYMRSSFWHGIAPTLWADRNRLTTPEKKP